MLLFSRPFEVLRPDDTGHGSIRANLKDKDGDIYTFPAYLHQAKAILNNVGGKVFATIQAEQFKDGSFTLTLKSVAVLEKGRNEHPREYRRKSNFPDLPVELAELCKGQMSCKPSTESE